ncbi:MAG: alpha-amylase family glycosyl hydrolase [Bacillota bacterium]|nr:alpha-amylase family glycosyl hydrolase [Bacillota bacterium]
MKKKKLSLLIAFMVSGTLLFGCASKTVTTKQDLGKGGIIQIPQNKDMPKLGYDGRVFYEIFVRSFNDSNGDGIGDLNGVTQKLDYLKDMGIKGIWLMPINSSPSYHGYDVSDYYSINKDYGSMEDFKKLVEEAHKRDIMVITDLVINHTSTESQWFKEASADKNSKYRNYYIWADKDTDLSATTSMSTNMWSNNGKDNYLAVFWSGMPDLNYDNKDVREEMKKVAKYYLDMGVDGFRLDAAKWIYEEDVKKNNDWWKEFNTYVKSINKNTILVGEINDSSTDKVAPYMKYLDSNFDFPAQKVIDSDIKNDALNGAVSAVQDSLNTYKAVNKDFKESIFIDNHDMDRVMSQFDSVDKAKVAAGMLLTLPGTPYVYYGDETGMTGSSPDEMRRQPFVWDNKDKTKNTSWETSINDIDKVAVNVEQKDSDSLLNFYKSLVNLRNNDLALEKGDFKELEIKDVNVAAYKRSYNGEDVYVYINNNSKAVKEKIDIPKGLVLFSNKRSDANLKFNGEIQLNGYEVLIIQKQ